MYARVSRTPAESCARTDVAPRTRAKKVMRRAERIQRLRMLHAKSSWPLNNVGLGPATIAYPNCVLEGFRTMRTSCALTLPLMSGFKILVSPQGDLDASRSIVSANGRERSSNQVLRARRPAPRSAADYSPSKYVNLSCCDELSFAPTKRTRAVTTIVRFTTKQGSSRNRRCRSVKDPSIRTSPAGGPTQRKCKLSGRTRDSMHDALTKSSSLSGRINRSDACVPESSIQAN